MKRFVHYLAVGLVLGVVLSCAGGQGSQQQGSGAKEPGDSVLVDIPAEETPSATPSHSFPSVSIPSVYGDNPELAKEYLLDHYWDAFIKGDGVTTSNSILGIHDKDVEQALSNYIQILSVLKAESTPDDQKSLRAAQKSIKNFFKKLETRQKDTTDLTYLRLTEMVSSYLYDPNSPMRDEDLYLPFVEAMLNSPHTRPDMLTAYKHELEMCRTNTYGSKVPDIRYKDIKGHAGTLYGVKADYTMLFFSNPGCESCKEIIKDVMSRGYVESMISDKRLAVVNIYIDEEVAKWRDYSHNYPSSWINGYDYTFSLRDSGDYDIRAIPSLYLLDSHKRVLMKDAPTERVLAFLDTL